MIPLSVPDEFANNIEVIKKEFARMGYERMFSPFSVRAIITSFETKDWGDFLGNKEKRVYSTADIVHDVHQDLLKGDEKWIKVIGDIE